MSTSRPETWRFAISNKLVQMESIDVNTTRKGAIAQWKKSSTRIYDCSAKTGRAELCF